MIEKLFEYFKEKISFWNLISSFLVSVSMNIAAYPMIGPLTESQIIGLILFGMVLELAFFKLFKKKPKTKKDENESK